MWISISAWFVRIFHALLRVLRLITFRFCSFQIRRKIHPRAIVQMHSSILPPPVGSIALFLSPLWSIRWGQTLRCSTADKNWPDVSSVVAFLKLVFCEFNGAWTVRTVDLSWPKQLFWCSRRERFFVGFTVNPFLREPSVPSSHFLCQFTYCGRPFMCAKHGNMSEDGFCFVRQWCICLFEHCWNKPNLSDGTI